MHTDGYTLVFEDTFQNLDRWCFDLGGGGWGNGEKQIYKQENAVLDGGLKLICKREEQGVSSARIYSKDSWQYGLFLVRAKVPAAKGTWPAIWMLGESFKTKRDWPYCGEIDIMEHTLCQPETLSNALHTGRYSSRNGKPIEVKTPNMGMTTDFHEYGIRWNERSITFLFDGQDIKEIARDGDGRQDDAGDWPYDAPFYLLLNVAYGGSMGGETAPERLPDAMEVEYVRVYQ